MFEESVLGDDVGPLLQLHQEPPQGCLRRTTSDDSPEGHHLAVYVEANVMIEPRGGSPSRNVGNLAAYRGDCLGPEFSVVVDLDDLCLDRHEITNP